MAITIVFYSMYDFYFDKGALVSVAMAIFPWFGFFNGFASARFYTFFNGSSWLKMALCTSFFLPGFLSAGLMIIDWCEWVETGRADTIPVREAAVLCYYWFFVHAPSCFAGSYMSFIRPPIESPVKKNRMARQEEKKSEMPYWCEIPGTAFIAGFPPSMVVMYQLWDLMKNVNGPANIHALHGMLYVIFALFLIVVVQVALINNYVTLTMQEPCWWWRVWWGASAVGGYAFVIMLFYLLLDLRVVYYTQLISYFTACFLASSCLGLMCASLAMIMTFRFNLRIYSKVKLVD